MEEKDTENKARTDCCHNEIIAISNVKATELLRLNNKTEQKLTGKKSKRKNVVGKSVLYVL